jgi:hypothetical protein
MHGRQSVLSIVALAVLANGCVYHHHLLTHGGNANQTTPFPKTINSGFWGTSPKPIVPPAGTPPEKSCNNAIDRNGMFNVHISSNLGYAAITVVTLGLWSPVHVEWTCAKDPEGPGVSGPSPSAARAAATAPVIPAPGANAKPKKPVFTNRTLHSLLWQLQTDAKAPPNKSKTPPPGPPTPGNCPTDGMRQVKIPVFPLNYFYSVVTVATVGIWSPMHVAWECMDDPAGGRSAAGTPGAATHLQEDADVAR